MQERCESESMDSWDMLNIMGARNSIGAARLG